jgi:hypothetical protein
MAVGRLLFGARNDADDVGQLAGVAGVEDAAEELVPGQDFVGLIDQQGGLAILDGAEDGRGADVGDAFRAVDEATQDGQEGAFAATVLG